MIFTLYISFLKIPKWNLNDMSIIDVIVMDGSGGLGKDARVK